jgi:hypothetical protein
MDYYPAHAQRDHHQIVAKEKNEKEKRKRSSTISNKLRKHILSHSKNRIG